MADAGVLEDQTVIVEGDRIVSLGSAASTDVRGARVIDARGKVLIPGLSDMHAHLTREEDLALYVARGVTLVRNMWGTPMHLAWRDNVARGAWLGPRIVTAGPILDGEAAVHDGSLVVRAPEDADRAIAEHVRLGYDFVKVYSRLSPPAYARLVEAAHARGLRVAGHVPRALGLSGVVGANQDVVEHLGGFVDAIQADGSPVAGKFDRASIDQKAAHVDEAKLPALAKRFADEQLFNCPTLDVVHNLTPEEQRRALARDEMKYMPAFYAAMWSGPRELPADVLAAQAGENALVDRIVVALDRANAPLLVGTDTGNPHVIPGFSVADEIERLVRAGLSNEAALRAATVTPAALLGEEGKSGIVAPGARADLVLLDANPLEDITALRKVNAVMAAGRWLDAPAIHTLLARAEASARTPADPWGGEPLTRDRAVFSARFDQTWKSASFGVEDVAVVEREGGRTVHARGFDGQYSQRSRVAIEVGPDGVWNKLAAESDGARGRGSIAARREPGTAHVHGTLLSGELVDVRAPLADQASLGVDKMLVGWFVAARQLDGLAVGTETRVEMAALELGSKAELNDAGAMVKRHDDVVLDSHGKQLKARFYTVTPAKGAPSRLWIDERGFPARFELEAFGDTVRYARVD
jgi:imidazolonepropionase-like amidohydrolase